MSRQLLLITVLVVLYRSLISEGFQASELEHAEINSLEYEKAIRIQRVTQQAKDNSFTKPTSNSKKKTIERDAVNEKTGQHILSADNEHFNQQHQKQQMQTVFGKQEVASRNEHGQSHELLQQEPVTDKTIEKTGTKDIASTVYSTSQSITNTRTNVKNHYDIKGDATVGTLGRRNTSPENFLTASSTITPFITAKLALDYLTSYDWMPLPTRWPIKLLVPVSKKETNKHKRELKTEKTYTQSKQDDLPYVNKLFKSTEQSNHNTHVDRLIEQGQEQESAVKVTNTDSLYPTANTKVRNKKSRKGRNKQTKKNRDNTSKKKKRRKKKMQFETPLEPASTTTDSGQVTQIHVLDQKVGFKQEKLHPLNNKSDAVTTTEFSNPKLPSDKVTLGTTLHSLKHPIVFGVNDHQDMPESQGSHNNKNSATDNGSVDHSNHADDPSLLPADTVGHPSGHDTGAQKLLELKDGRMQLSQDLHASVKNIDAPDQTFNTLGENGQNKNSHEQTFVSLRSRFLPEPKFTTDSYLKSSSRKEMKACSQNCTREITNVSRDNTGPNIPDRNSRKHVQDHTNSGPDIWSDISGTQLVTNLNKFEKEVKERSGTTEALPLLHQSKPVVYDSDTIKDAQDSTNNDQEMSERRHFDLDSVVTAGFTSLASTTDNYPDLASARRWRDMLKQKQQITHKPSRNSKHGIHRENLKGNKRRGSLSTKKSKSKSNSRNFQEAETRSSKSQDVESKEQSPFINYKSAFDFLSSQNGLQINVQNEARREANELNRFMGEGMCEIFSKHYVPTRIGGKCE